MNDDMLCETVLNYFCARTPTLRYVYKSITTTPILLGNNYCHQFFTFGCIFSQIISTLLLIVLYYKTLTVSYIWWPLIECFRVGILGIIRVDQSMKTEPSILCNNEQQIYKTIAYLNIFGLIWTIPFWIFYVSISLKGSNGQNTIFFIVTFIYICLHILSSMPSISQLFKLISINRHLIINNLNDDENQFGDSFLSSSINVESSSPATLRNNHNALISPESSRISIIDPCQEVDDEEENESDPIMYTAPMRDDDQDSDLNDNRISSMTHLINDKRFRIGTLTPDIEDDHDDISGDGL